MDINVTVKIESPEIIAAVLALAESMTQMRLGVNHFWQEENNKMPREILGREYEKDLLLVRRDSNNIIKSEGEQKESFDVSKNENSILKMKKVEVDKSEEVKTSIERTIEHIDETVKEEVTKGGNNKTITLEQVRAKLAALSQQGKQPQIKELLKKYGTSKLTAVNPENYEELLIEAEKL